MSAVVVGRVVWVALVVAGFAQLAFSVVTREPPNEYGFVPGAVLSLMLITAGWLAGGLVMVVADRKFGWPLALVVVLIAWLIGGPALVLWGQPGSLREIPFGSLIAAAAAGAVLFTMAAPIITAFVLVWLALASAADRVPFLQRISPRAKGADIEDRPT